jgi:hypothetical protein
MLVNQLEGKSIPEIFNLIQSEMATHRNLLNTKKSSMSAREAGCDYYLHQITQLHSYLVSGTYQGGIDLDVLTAFEKIVKDAPKV